MLAHADFPFPLAASLPLLVDPAPQDYIQIDPALLAISNNPPPAKPEKVKRARGSGGRKRRKVEGEHHRLAHMSRSCRPKCLTSDDSFRR